MDVKAILQRKGNKVVTIAPDTTVGETTQILKRERIGAVVVCDGGGGILGIVSERDIVNGLADEKRREGLLGSKVSTLMTCDVVTCSPADQVQKCMQLMTDRHIRHLPVVDDGAMVGLVSIGDIVKSRLEDLESEAGFLRGMIAS